MKGKEQGGLAYQVLLCNIFVVCSVSVQKVFIQSQRSQAQAVVLLSECC